MQNFLDLFMSVYNFMKNTVIYTFTIGETNISLTFLGMAIGAFITIIGIDVLHHIFEW